MVYSPQVFICTSQNVEEGNLPRTIDYNTHPHKASVAEN